MRNKIIILLLIVAWLGTGACSNFLKEESQSEVIPKTTADFSELLLGTGYPDVNSPSFSFTSLMDDDCALFLTYVGRESDQYAGSNSAILNFPYYSWQPYASDYDGYGNEINVSPSSTTYGAFYAKILGCNAVLDYIDDAVGPDNEKERVKAEALAVRSLLYFQLVNIYGEPYNHNKEALGVPVRLTADLTEEHLKRETVAYIYEEVIAKGLEEAARLMDPLPVIRKNYRVNQPAIHILLSRVYLYMERYEECIAEVDKAIEQGAILLDMVNALDYIASGNLYYPITYDNPEVEWLFGPSAVSSAYAYQPGTAPEFRELWDEINDQRFLANNFKSQKDYNDIPTNNVLMTKPYGGNNFGQSIRFAEAVLNRMEAYALLGDNESALAELNNFRKKRIIGYTDENYGEKELLEQIRLERRKELCFEGHRWFDLRRQGMPEIKHSYKFEKGGTLYNFVLKAKDPLYTIPLPNSLLLQNSGLLQNSSRENGDRQGNTII
ncbi:MULTISPECIES: RagB/SusD family nutrient uptake outer membrane protein [Butyricimonas]|uniref:RagB/SusD family nutrient uptake outer membrane protein n=1 Tax=Butyricimonas hominis TaxID=2763032 RepID=A0ABR7D6A8_9BACT|nr:RagB/SusD family nutrient uptake outer membrane protein [Butyricimonas hominis]MBC5623491.1 RagB/SusD family nutrient uptake outer membrane protein [Butyricimonas hominis]